jgi:hypothetical protein
MAAKKTTKRAGKSPAKRGKKAIKILDETVRVGGSEVEVTIGETRPPRAKKTAKRKTAKKGAAKKTAKKGAAKKTAKKGAAKKTAKKAAKKTAKKAAKKRATKKAAKA